MLPILFSLLLTSTITYIAPTAYAQSVPQTNKQHIEQDIIQDCPISQRGVATIIVTDESDFDPLAKGDYATSTGYTSFGTVQIHLPAHPEITKAQADDIDFSVKYLCDNLVAGNGKMWSTYPIKGD